MLQFVVIVVVIVAVVVIVIIGIVGALSLDVETVGVDTSFSREAVDSQIYLKHVFYIYIEFSYFLFLITWCISFIMRKFSWLKHTGIVWLQSSFELS